MENLLIVIIVVWILLRLWMALRPVLRQKQRAIKTGEAPDIFDRFYLDSEAFYLYRFGTVPCTTYIDRIDIVKAFMYLRENFGEQIQETYQANYFNRNEGKQEFEKTILVFHDKVVIQLCWDEVKILFPSNEYDFTDTLLNKLNDIRLPEKAKDFEINIITLVGKNLHLKRLDIKPSRMDIGMFYNDDFAEIDGVIRKRLNQTQDKGIVLLHGLPGTGKTSYLRHLLREMKKKVLFVSPTVARSLMNPEFIDLLIDNPNSVLVIEDAENIMMDRKFDSDSSVSNLLNLSDGLLSDCVSVQIICTFNSSLDLIDPALMRKGRLIAKYEFGKLETVKAQQLSNLLGFDTVIRYPMTIADIANQHDKSYGAKKMDTVGFKRQEVPQN